MLDADGRVLAEAVLSQEREHARVSAAWCRRSPRARIWRTCPAWSRRVMANAGVGFADLAGVAATAGRG